MSQIVFAHLDKRAADEPASATAALSGEGTSMPVVAGPGRPLQLWRHDLAAGAVLRWPSPGPERVIFVRRGAAIVAGRTVPSCSSIVAEAGASPVVEAGPDGATLLEFFRPGPSRHDPASAAAIHIHDGSMPAGLQAETGMLYAMLSADRLPSCDAWMHRTDYPAGHRGAPHTHTDDEIIVVIDGTLRLGSRREPAGTVLAIDKGTVYSVSAGDDGVSFINFRPNPTLYVGRTIEKPVVDEVAYFAAIPRAPDGMAWFLAGTGGV